MEQNNFQENYKKCIDAIVQKANHLSEKDFHADPVVQFKSWLETAYNKNLKDPNAMILATVDSQGKPSARTMILRKVDEKGFLFFTNYKSKKAKELDANPFVALVFFWPELYRQVRVEGSASKISTKEADEYFNKLPLQNKLTELISHQSEVIDFKNGVEKIYERLKKEYDSILKNFVDEKSIAIPRPEHWGGYLVQPNEIEFWQGQPTRIHDRIRYRKNDKDIWVIERLAP